MGPAGMTYGTLLRAKRVDGEPVESASHARYVPGSPATAALVWHALSAPANPPTPPRNALAVTNAHFAVMHALSAQIVPEAQSA
jgi:hypothetical protein